MHLIAAPSPRYNSRAWGALHWPVLPRPQLAGFHLSTEGPTSLAADSGSRYTRNDHALLAPEPEAPARRDGENGTPTGPSSGGDLKSGARSGATRSSGCRVSPCHAGVAQWQSN